MRLCLSPLHCVASVLSIHRIRIGTGQSAMLPNGSISILLKGPNRLTPLTADSTGRLRGQSTGSIARCGCRIVGSYYDHYGAYEAWINGNNATECAPTGHPFISSFLLGRCCSAFLVSSTGGRLGGMIWRMLIWYILVWQDAVLKVSVRLARHQTVQRVAKPHLYVEWRNKSRRNLVTS
jgi:hypothetical protein